MPDRRRIWTIGLISLCVFYCAVRFWRMSDSCLWFDEVFSVHAAEHDWGSLFWFVAQDLIHPPLFYAILKIWIGVGGDSIFWLRLLPVAFSCLALIPFYLLSRELKLDHRVFVFAAFFLAVNGTFIKYAQLVRMYSLLLLISLLSIWLFARYFNRGKNLTALIIVNLVMVYTHYYGWLVVGSEIAAILLFQRFKWRGMAVMAGALSVLFLPWIWLVWKASQTGSELTQNISWIARPGFAEIGTYIIDLTEPFYFQASSAEPASNYFISIPLLLIFVTALVMFFVKFRNFQPDTKQKVYFLGMFSLMPIVVVLLASWVLPHSIWGTRHLTVAAGPLMLLAAMVFDKFDQGIARIAAITLLVLFSGFAFVLEVARPAQVYVWCAWEGIANEIASNTREDEVAKIYTFENLVAYHVWFATRNSRRVEVAAIKGVEGMHEDESYFLPRGFDGVERASLKDIGEEKAVLLFRTERAGQENSLLDRLRENGYRVCRSTPMKFGRTEIHAIEMVMCETNCGVGYSAAFPSHAIFRVL